MRKADLDLLRGKENESIKEMTNPKGDIDQDQEKNLLENIDIKEKALERDTNEEIIGKKEGIRMIGTIEEIGIDKMIEEEKKIMIGMIEEEITKEETIIKKEGKGQRRVMMI